MPAGEIPRYTIQRLVMTARGNLRDRGTARLEVGDPGFEVTIAWHSYQELRSMFHTATAGAGRAMALTGLGLFHAGPLPGIARLGRTLRSWQTELLSTFDTGEVSNGGTEATNPVLEKTRCLTHGFRNCANYQLTILLAPDGTRPCGDRRGGTTSV